MNKYFDLINCNALIAGGATGLGFEMANGLLYSGCDVIIIGRRESIVNNSVKELSKIYSSRKCTGMVCDISNENSLNKITKEIKSQYNNKLNIAINSAGINVRNRIENVSLEEWESIQKVNITGAFLFAKSVYPLLDNASFGRLINITSIFSSVSYPDRVSYSSSKGALLQLTKTLALEWANSKITVNSISPGPFLTEINLPVLNNPKSYKEFCNNIPKGRFGDPEEIITSCLFLSSPFSNYINGSNIVVDGGWLSC